MSVAQRAPRRTETTPPTALEVSIVMPCLNEAETLAKCIGHAQAAIATGGLSAEIIVADNGSTDGSQAHRQRARARGSSTSPEGVRQRADRRASMRRRGRFVVMGDADDSYDFEAIGPVVDKLREGYDLVDGQPLHGWHRAGRDALVTSMARQSGALRSSAASSSTPPSATSHCGLRASRKEAYERMRLRATGMEFASEMVIKASLRGMRIAEVPGGAPPRRPLAPAAPAHVARRLAPPAVHAAVQPALAVPLSRRCLVRDRRRAVSAPGGGTDPGRRGAARHPHPAGGGIPVARRLSARALRGLHQDLRHPHGLPPTAPGPHANVQIITLEVGVCSPAR